MLIFFMMATLGVFFFNGIKEGVIINRFKNFETWDDAFLLLFAISTGEEWNLLMYDCGKMPPNCTEGVDCGSALSWVYYVVFIVFVTHIMLNLFILVIIEQFDKYYNNEDSPLKSFSDKFEKFEEEWIPLTQMNGCVKLKEKQLIPFYKKLHPIIGMSNPKEMKDDAIKKNLLKMGIKSEGGFIYFNELLYRLMREKYVKFKLNTPMAILELTTQFKLYQMT